MKESFVQWLPQGPAGHHAEVHVRRLSKDIADWWHHNIQPMINQDSSRPDSGWSWPTITAWNHWADPLTAHPRGFALCLGCADGHISVNAGLPQVLALVQLVARIPFIEDRSEYSVLLHYLTTVPRVLLDQKPIGLVGQAAVDISLVHALRLGYAGRMIAVIGRKDRHRLAIWYADKCGMISYGQPPGHRFIHRPSTAMAAYARLQQLRLQEVRS